MINVIEVSCRICRDNSEYKIVQDNLVDIEDGVEGKYEICKCSSCKNLFLGLTPTVETLKNAYIKNYHVREVSSKKLIHYFYVIRAYIKSRIIYISLDKNKNNKIMEYGSGDGEILYQLAKIDKKNIIEKLYGLELVAKTSKIIKNNHEIIFTNDIERLKIKNNSLDLIISYEVIEHLPYPNEILEKILSKLKNNGVFIGSVPNYNSLGRCLFRKYWSGYQIPRHQYFFCKDTLNKILLNNGYKNIKLKVGFDPGEFPVSLLNIIQNYLKIKANPRKNKLYIIFIITFLPISYFIYLIGLSGTIKFKAFK